MAAPELDVRMTPDACEKLAFISRTRGIGFLVAALKLPEETVKIAASGGRLPLSIGKQIDRWIAEHVE